MKMILNVVCVVCAFVFGVKVHEMESPERRFNQAFEVVTGRSIEEFGHDANLMIHPGEPGCCHEMGEMKLVEQSEHCLGHCGLVEGLNDSDRASFMKKVRERVESYESK